MQINAARKKLRDHLVAECSPQLVRELIDINGQQVEVRQMTGGQMDRINRASSFTSRDPARVDNHAFCVECALELVFVPSTDERVFGPEDREMLENLPALTPWLLKIGETVSSMFGRAHDAGKASGTTPAADSSSASPESSASPSQS